MFDDAVASVVPDVHAEGEVRLGSSWASPTRLALARRYLYSMLLRPEYLSRKLDRSLPTKGGGTLRTVLDARTYMPALSKDREHRANGRGAELLFAKADVAAFSKQVELAPFYDAKLDVAAMV